MTALTWPEWLKGDLTNEERLSKIMAAVHRCYMEHENHDQVPSGPHMTISVAENFIRQML